MKNFLGKFSSRKFLVAVAGIVTGMVAFFGIDENSIAQIAGATTSVISIVAYIFGEARIDAAAVNTAQKDGEKS